MFNTLIVQRSYSANLDVHCKHFSGYFGRTVFSKSVCNLRIFYWIAVTEPEASTIFGLICLNLEARYTVYLTVTYYTKIEFIYKPYR